MVQDGLGRLRNIHPTVGWVDEERVELIEETIFRSGYPDYWAPHRVKEPDGGASGGFWPGGWWGVDRLGISIREVERYGTSLSTWTDLSVKTPAPRKTCVFVQHRRGGSFSIKLVGYQWLEAPQVLGSLH